MRKLDEIMGHLEQQIEQRNKQRSSSIVKASTEESAPSEETESAQIVPFPNQWGEHLRGTPNICLRSALFGVVRRGKRQYIRAKVLISQDGYKVCYTGERLDQADLDIWQQAIHLCRHHAVGERVFFSRKSFLKAIGRNDGKSARDWLKRGLDRMVACAVILEHDRKRYADNMLGWGVDEHTGRMFLRLNRDIAQFFERDAYTLVDFQRRLSLSSQTSKWLHDYYSSHAEPYPVSVRKLRDLCGSESKDLFHFREELKPALTELLKAGLLESYEIDKRDLVRVKKCHGIGRPETIELKDESFDGLKK